jgi:hypothetical protein
LFNFFADQFTRTDAHHLKARLPHPGAAPVMIFTHHSVQQTKKNGEGE